MARIPDSERTEITAALHRGQSVGSVAREFGRAKGSVSAIAKAAGIDPGRSATKKATQARKDYAQAERLNLLNQFFKRAETMLPITATPKELQELTTALAIMIDKRRLEDGEATSRAEVNDDRDARERIAGRLDELAARRRAEGVA